MIPAVNETNVIRLGTFLTFIATAYGYRKMVELKQQLEEERAKSSADRAKNSADRDTATKERTIISQKMAKDAEASRQDYCKMAATVVDLKNRCNTLESERDAHKELNRQQAAAIEALTNAKDGLENALRIGEAKVQRLEGNWEQLELENSELRGQKEALEGEITLSKAVKAQHVAKIAGLEDEITRAHSALEEARQQIALYAPALDGYRQLLTQETTRKALLHLATNSGGVRGIGPATEDLERVHRIMLDEAAVLAEESLRQNISPTANENLA